MLLRICDHFRNNPKRIDKLIAIKGLPKEWIFRETDNGVELRAPWKADVEENIPHNIRHLCEPMYVNFRYPPIEKGAKEIIDHRKIIGLKIDYNSEPGREMWDRVERYVEESIPRNERIPVPVLCAKDERSAFETYTPRRSPIGSLELVPSEVPLVDLTQYVQVAVQERPIQPPVVSPPPPTMTPAEAAPQVRVPQVAEFKCEECSQEFTYEKSFKKHLKDHRKEKVGA